MDPRDVLGPAKRRCENSSLLYILLLSACCSEVFCTDSRSADFVPGPDRWNDIPDATYEVNCHLSNFAQNCAAILPLSSSGLAHVGWLIVPKYSTRPPIINQSIVHDQRHSLEYSFEISSAGAESASYHLIVFQGTFKKAQPLSQVIYGREAVITVPSGDLKGVLVALPGCLQLTTEWGFQSATCPSCHGGVLSSAPELLCWHHNELDIDIHFQYTDAICF